MPTQTVIENHRLYVDHPDLPEGQKYIEILYYPNSHAYKLNGEKLIGVSGVGDIIEKEGLRWFWMNEALAHVHRYLDENNDGNFLRTVTSLDQWLELSKKAKVAHKVKSDRGKEAGTRVHTWLEQFLIAKRDKAEPPQLPEAIKIPKKEKGMSWQQVAEIDRLIEDNNLIEALSQFMRYCQSHQVEVIDLERLVFSKRYKYAGRFDAILRIDGKLMLVDFKTNNPTSDYPDGIFPEQFIQVGGYDIAYTQEFAPELDKQNKSLFDGHAIFNFSKKTGKFSKRFNEGDDLLMNRNGFTHALGLKRVMQHKVRQMSMKYKENRPAAKKKGKNV